MLKLKQICNDISLNFNYNEFVLYIRYEVNIKQYLRWHFKDNIKPIVQNKIK